MSAIPTLLYLCVLLNVLQNKRLEANQSKLLCLPRRNQLQRYNILYFSGFLLLQNIL